MTDSSAVRAEDILPVKSRISWGPIFAGAALSLALYFLLMLLGAALGMSVSDRVRAENLGTGAAIWAILTTAFCLFVGGIVTSQLSVGENKLEALLYGLIMWAVVFGMLMWLMASGVRGSFNAIVGLATAGAVATPDHDWESAARRGGVSQEQINEWNQKVKNSPESARKTAEDPQNQQAALEVATKTAWWAFAGTLVSMLAAAAGSLVGSGPTIRLLPTGRMILVPRRHAVSGGV